MLSDEALYGRGSKKGRGHDGHHPRVLRGDWRAGVGGHQRDHAKKGRREVMEGGGGFLPIEKIIIIYESLKSSKRVIICCQNAFESLKRLLHRTFLPLSRVEVWGFQDFF